jgi:Holliday junction resolvase-like predicted endonuclease
MDHNTLGQLGEKTIAQWFRWQEYQIKGQNILTPYGEMDLWVQKRNRSYFVEIKTRRHKPQNLSVSGLTTQKKRRLRSIYHYLKISLPQAGKSYCSYILLIPQGIYWIPHLFEANPFFASFSKVHDKPWRTL